ncbi:hypothetical protein SAMN04490186_4949 [Pseudomonas grimontii]|uniref:Uncharacterized protein n=1 Tax=Pseudomonas grimontii TaxID=129847 RepID=A0A1H1HZ89_9PSED|nr:hypothetical protein [Pseudomonas grimontii]TWR56223.1 hypothetical protein FIV39_29680 [Pseudomonas grimontii]SDR30767.1 hypothetical protein SAMN04490186_4949 [Pseudomonas grimontii]
MFEGIELQKPGRGTATGTMTGTVKNLYTNVVSTFKAEWIWRDNQEGTLRFHGTVDDLEKPGETALIGLLLDREDVSSGTYRIGDTQVKLTMSYMTFIRETGAGKRQFIGLEGWVELKNSYPDKPISGTLWFKTKSIVLNNYEVNLNFDITDF